MRKKPINRERGSDGRAMPVSFMSRWKGATIYGCAATTSGPARRANAAARRGLQLGATARESRDSHTGGPCARSHTGGPCARAQGRRCLVRCRHARRRRRAGRTGRVESCLSGTLSGHGFASSGARSAWYRAGQLQWPGYRQGRLGFRPESSDRSPDLYGLGQASAARGERERKRGAARAGPHRQPGVRPGPQGPVSHTPAPVPWLALRPTALRARRSCSRRPTRFTR